MSYLDRIRACNDGDTRRHHALFAAGHLVGWLQPGFAHALRRWPGVFRVGGGAVWVREDLGGFESRSRAVDEVVRACVEEGLIGHYLDERYPVTPGRREDAVMWLDRGAAARFGIRAFGQHLNGFVRRDDGLWMWVARRSDDRRHAPGKLDNLVAGGLPLGLSLQENLVKECAEEAGMAPALAQRAVLTGMISYLAAHPMGLKPDVMYCYDLELPEDFAPRCTDGEVAGFELMPMDEVLARVRDTTDFKANCNLVIIDFAVRHGLITPDLPDYEAVLLGLRRRLPFPG